MKSISNAYTQPHTVFDREQSGEQQVILLPIAMRIPNEHGIYSPTELKPKKMITYEKFLANYAHWGKKIRVCFDTNVSSAEIVRCSQLIEAYCLGLEGWYILDTDSSRRSRSF